ncbi:hypothetical protein D3C81_1656330 [compost metagenome]
MRRRKSARPVYGYEIDRSELFCAQPEVWRDTNQNFDYFRKLALKAEFGVPIKSEN